MIDQAETSTIPSITIPQKEYQQLQEEVAFLKQQLKDLQRMIFGRKSERFIPSDSQLNIFGEQPSCSESQQIAIKTITRESKPAKQKPIRQLLPAHLPRVEEIIEPEGLLEGSKKIGELVTEILEYDPGSIWVRRIVRPKYVYPGEDGVRIGELPKLPIPKGNAGASLLAHIQVSKWVDHLPYYRQVGMLKRQGIELSESTVNGWFRAISELLQPLYENLVGLITSQHYLQADESPIKVLEADQAKSSRTGYHWVYHAPVEKLVVFYYQPTRSRNGPQRFLKDFSGSLQTDGYSVYNELGLPNPITLLACMAHARRYFEKALDNDKARAEHALGVIRQLYQIEGQAKEQSLDDEAIKKLRQQEAIPILWCFKEWLEVNLNQVLPKSKMGKAIRYSLNLWDKLIRYTQQGIYKIDNNLIENTIRPLALGRKNYLFAGSNKAAQRAAMMYSFFATCKMHQVEPYAWLKDVLNRIPDHKVNQLEELLPQNWKPGEIQGV